MNTWLKNNRGFLIFLLCFGFFRTAVAEWNPVPTGSMRPTILEGDVVLVNRLAYDFKIPLTDISMARLGEPKRGDIVTFSSPKDGTKLIKRVVALPGDVVHIQNNVLFINGKPAKYTEAQQVLERMDNGLQIETLRATEQIAGNSRTVQYLSRLKGTPMFGPVVVPKDSYFMMGDNRNNSEDSRFIGFVQRKLLIGRAERTLVSADIKNNWRPRPDRTWARMH
jgi:signal peptidase I